MNIIFGKPFLLYHRSGHSPQPCSVMSCCPCCVQPSFASSCVMLQGAKPCPGCGVRTLRSMGCNHMTCTLGSSKRRCAMLSGLLWALIARAGLRQVRRYVAVWACLSWFWLARKAHERLTRSCAKMVCPQMMTRTGRLLYQRFVLRCANSLAENLQL